MTDITIRHSETKDIEAIRQIIAHPAVYANTLQAPYPSVEKWQQRVGALQHGSVSLVAEMEGEVVGHLGFHPVPNPR
jgi:putative acetyltransferase